MRRAYGCGLALGMAWALAACGDQGALGGPASGAPVKANVSGSAQKGPFSNGSQVSISELDVNLVQTGRTFSTTMNDDGGSYSVRGVQLGTPYARVEVNGFYFDEVRGQLSASPLSLFSYVDLSDRTTSNINLLGHLEAARLEHLVAEEGVSFGAAKAQAHREVLEMFQLDPDAIGSAEDLDISKAGEGNAALFAISVMLQGTRTVAELSELLSNIQSDLGSDGTLDNAANGSALMAGATMVDLAHARENLAARFDTLGVDATVPDITGQVSRFAETAPYVYTGGGIDYPIGMSRPNLLDPGMARFDFDAKFPALGFAVVLPEVSNVKIRITNHASNDAQTPTSIWYYGVNSTLLDWTVSNYDFDTGVQEFTSKHSGPGDLESFGFMGSGSATLEYFENGGSTPARTKQITWSGWESFGGTTVPDGRPIGVGTGGYGGTTGTGGSAGDGSGGYAGDGAGGAGGYAGDPNLPPDDGKVCGDGVRGPGEQCDDGNRVGGDGCGPSCLYEAAPQFVCGNGVVEPGEDCDGTDTNGMTCAQLRPGTTGEPGCDPVVCRFQPTTCQDACGNGVIDQGEDCDGANLNGMTCATYMPGTSGELQCEPGICRFDSLSCEQTCGNGLLDQGEECDPGLPLSGCDQCDPSCHIMPISCP